jgi:cell wall-associated NlpC family hydrolase
MVVRPRLALIAAALLAAALPLAATAQALPPSPPGQPRQTAPFSLASGDALPPAPPPAAVQLDAPAGGDLAAVEAAAEQEDEAGLAAPATEPGLLPAGAAPAGGEPLGDEFGAAYAVSVREANSLLNRLSARLRQLVEQTWTFLGTPYRRGGTSRHGLDCSGLVGAVYGEQGMDLPRTAAEQFSQGTPVADGDLRPGDLVFFRDTYKRGISHVGIFVGDGRFIHAAGRRQGVIVSELARPYFRSRFAGARRLSPLAAAALTTGAAAEPPATPPPPPVATAAPPDLASGRAMQR